MIDLKEKQRLKKFIKELEVIKGRHTELVSVYIPSGYELIKIIQHLQQEQGTAENIKDKTTRNNVIDSLERMIRHLRLFKRTPEKGLAVFSGNKSEREGQQDIQVWSIEPPEPIKTRLYRCDQTFVLDLLREQLDVKEVYGLLVIDNREANLGFLRGTSITEVAKLESQVPGKIKAGGQSQARFARLREGAAHYFYTKIGEACNKEFLPLKNDLKGLLVGGPGPTKEIFLNGDYLNNELKKKIIGTKDLSYTGDFGLNELVDKSQEELAKEIIAKEKALMNKFFDMLNKEADKIAYGEKEVRKALEYGAVDTLLLSEALDDKLIEELNEIAEKNGSKVEIISVETREGVQLRDLTGIGAILRFALPSS